MKTILVTGGCGFIGANFIKIALSELADVQLINLDKLTYAGNLENLRDVEHDPRYSFVHGDICNQQLIDKLFLDHPIDTVVHFAAESHVDRSIDGPAEFIQTNINGTFALLEAAKKKWLRDGVNLLDKRFLHVSTDEVYGSLGDSGLFAETMAYDPRSPYSASKAASDHLVSAYGHTYNLPVLITNCSNNYGPFQFPEKLIPLIFNNALNGKELPVYGDGKNVRDWLFVEDHCRAILTVLQHGRIGETYNIGGHSERQNIDVVRLICDVLDEKVVPLANGKKRQSLICFVKDRSGHDRRYAVDTRKIVTELGWKPSLGFDEGIRLTIDWYLENSVWVDNVLDGSYQEYYTKMYEGR